MINWTTNKLLMVWFTLTTVHTEEERINKDKPKLFATEDQVLSHYIKLFLNNNMAPKLFPLDLLQQEIKTLELQLYENEGGANLSSCVPFSSLIDY